MVLAALLKYVGADCSGVDCLLYNCCGITFSPPDGESCTLFCLDPPPGQCCPDSCCS